MPYLDNEMVFKATVKELLEMGGIDNLEKPPESLLEVVSHGGGSEATALNLIIQAHVAYLLIEVWTPFEKDDWTIQLADIKPRFRQGLSDCHELLLAQPSPEVRLAVHSVGGWNDVIPKEYGLNGWDDFGDYFFFKGGVSICALLDYITSITVLALEEKTDDLLVVTDSLTGEKFTTWRVLFTANVIQTVIDSNIELEF